MAGRLILTISAALLLLGGGIALFAPQETLAWLGSPPSIPSSVLVQVGASAIVALAVVDWMSRNNRIGGIYARPLGLGNLLFFASSALAFGKELAERRYPVLNSMLCLIFSVVALAFAWLLFASDPLPRNSAAAES